MTIEFHSFGKFAPGFVTDMGKINEQKGALSTTRLSIGFFAVATVTGCINEAGGGGLDGWNADSL
jgi:hypothetical protein